MKLSTLFIIFEKKRTKNTDTMKKNIITVLAAVLLSGLTAFGVARTVKSDTTGAAVTYADGTAYRTVNLSETDYPDFTFAAETAVDAVVYVQVSGTQKVQYFNPFADFFPFFGDGSGQPQTREKEFRGSGSGVIIRQDGYIVTNNHVVADASDIQVMLNNNKTFPAKLIGADAATDVALIKIEAEGLPCLPFADSDGLRLGEWVLAIGSPLGRELQSTITAGIVSAKGRSMPNQDGEFRIESFIQTDAAVNPGNSGGALVNKSGALVGINTAIVSTTGSYSGYSFAVPSNIVKKVVDDFIDFGSVQRVMLGITGGTLTAELAKELKLSEPAGVYISEVRKGSSADKAGLKEKDVIVSLDSTHIRTMADLQAKVNSFHPGDKVAVKYYRNSTLENAEVTFFSQTSENGTVQDDGTIVFYGATLKAVEGGVEIVSVGTGKMQEAGAQEGFVIKYVNDQKVSKPEEVVSIAKKTKRAIFIEGVLPNGRPSYFGFGKE